MRADSGVGAHGDRNPGRVCAGDRGPVGFDDPVGLVHDRGRQALARLGGLDHGLRGLQGRDQVGAVLEHEVDGFVIEVDAVLDRADTGTDGVLDARCALRMGHHVCALGGRLGDDDADLGLGELGVARIVAR